MKSDNASYCEQDPDPQFQVTRRTWLQGLGCSVGISALALSASGQSNTQDAAIQNAVRSLTTMTGAEIPEPWVGPTALLVGIILDYSKDLRQLDLGDLELPAIYRPR
jgi:hypothetical protein